MKSLPTGYQVRAARSLIGWSQVELAKASRLDPATIVRMEKSGDDPVRSPNLQEVITALSRAGVEFTDRGVELTKKPR